MKIALWGHKKKQTQENIRKIKIWHRNENMQDPFGNKIKPFNNLFVLFDLNPLGVSFDFNPLVF